MKTIDSTNSAREVTIIGPSSRAPGRTSSAIAAYQARAMSSALRPQARVMAFTVSSEGTPFPARARRTTLSETLLSLASAVKVLPEASLASRSRWTRARSCGGVLAGMGLSGRPAI
jgi:hypothetical protein